MLGLVEIGTGKNTQPGLFEPQETLVTERLVTSAVGGPLHGRV